MIYRKCTTAALLLEFENANRRKSKERPDLVVLYTYALLELRRARWTHEAECFVCASLLAAADLERAA